MKPLIGARLPQNEHLAVMVRAAHRLGIPPTQMVMKRQSGEDEPRIYFPVLPLEDDE